SLFKMLKIVGFAGDYKEEKEHLKEIVDEAVDLRNDITGELATYHFSWDGTYEKLDHDDQIEYRRQMDPTAVSLCVWPALLRRIKDDDGTLRDICITPARVELVERF